MSEHPVNGKDSVPKLIVISSQQSQSCQSFYGRIVGTGCLSQRPCRQEGCRTWRNAQLTIEKYRRRLELGILESHLIHKPSGAPPGTSRRRAIYCAASDGSCCSTTLQIDALSYSWPICFSGRDSMYSIKSIDDPSMQQGCENG